MFYGYGILNNHVPTLRATVMGGVAITDTDVLAFISAASITNTTQKSAINKLVTDLKTASIWTKMKAIYPFVGGTASQHKFNLKDPRDLNVAYRLQFVNGWTHSANGVTPNGTDAYADTNLIPFVGLTTNNLHLSHYSRTQITSTNSHDMGAEQGPPYGYSCDLYQYYNSVSAKGFLDGTYPQDASQANNANTLGLLIGTRTANNNQKTYFNGTLQNTNTNTKILALPSYSIYIGATNRDLVATSLSTKQSAFASIGDGLTAAEALSLYNAVNTYQITLSRNV